MFPIPIISNTSIAPIPLSIEGILSTDGLATLIQPTAYFGYCSAQGEFYILYGTTNLFQKYNPKTNTVSSLTPPVRQAQEPAGITGYTTVCRDGKIYAYRNSSAMSIYDIDTDTWEYKTMNNYGTNTGIHCHSAIIGDIMYIWGGMVDSSKFNNRLYTYNITTNEWNFLSSPPIGTSAEYNINNDACSTPDGKLYFMTSSGLYQFDIGSSNWIQLAGPQGMNYGRLCYVNYTLYMYGGYYPIKGTIFLKRFNFESSGWVNVGLESKDVPLTGGCLLTPSAESAAIYYIGGKVGSGNTTNATITKIT